MLRSISETLGYHLHAQDGEIGRTKDYLFDDQFWTVRYMVADTGTWLPGRRVLISPISLGEPRWRDKAFPVRLSTEQIEAAPGVEEAAPVSRQYEKQLARYYGYPPYWIGPNTWGALEAPLYPEVQTMIDDKRLEKEAEDLDIHLRSAKEVIGYDLHADDGRVGHVEDFILDDEMWTLRYLVVDTRNWLPGRKVLISPMWVQLVEWLHRKVQVNLSVEAVKNSPPYDSAAPVNREYEERLYDFYGRPKYWK
ncbi:PRC-barrel domain-containing protein [Desulfatitalea alkaliphila]|uniref:PRC-barrel domain-containing protein n=1 Tax=Desulfatitalea alkaliphila TaxID=2929485 RepID=A0AA41UHG4_9BACT|nr:PRC-barrel domain-containing protein [Desulfatitalea alkaliphila]MCJ8499004.1 PRC-barrel domain-containing protein [Desulfatitalea alkaliphila]